MKTFTVTSSHGTLTVNAETGLVEKCDCDHCDEYCIDNIRTFDLKEYKSFYNVTEMPEYIDILDLGYWDENETYEEPAHDWRELTIELRKGFDIEDITGKPETSKPAYNFTFEVGLLVAHITYNMFDEIHENVRKYRNGGVVETYATITQWATEFEKTFKEFNWEELLLAERPETPFSLNCSCWDEAVLEWSRNQLSNMSKLSNQ